MATIDPLRYTNSKLDTVEAGIEVVKAKVGLVDEKVGIMAEDWKLYGPRINALEDNIHYHDTKMDEFNTREGIHSAKLRTLEEELSKLRTQNNRLQDELHVMHKSPRFVEDDREKRKNNATYDKHYNEKRNVDFQKGQLSHRETYREQMYGPDNENRYYTRDNQRFSNRDRERELEAQIRREMGKIEMHDGNFKPWGRDAYQNPSHHPGPNYVNDRYLRPEERQLRHQLDYDKSPVTESKPENQDVRPQTEPALPIRSDFEPKSTNSGVYLFVRTNKLAKADVVKALQEGRSVLANSYGQLKGIATSREINLLEGRADGWTNKPSTEANKVWDIDDIVIIIWFPTSKEAEMWLCHEKHFRNASFPEFYGSDIVVLPINWNPTNDRHYPTFLVTEYEGIVDPDQFREKFVTNMNGVLQRHKAERFVIQTVGIKNLRGNWFKKRSVVTCNRFPSSEAAYQFYNDPEYENLRRSLRDISKNRTTVMFTLTERPV